MTSTRAQRLRRCLLVLAVALGLVLPGGNAGAEDRDDLARQREQAREEMERLRSSLEGVDTDLAETYLALEEANSRLPVAEQELARAQEELAAAERTAQQVDDRLSVAEAERESLAAEISAAEQRIADSEHALGELARSTYRGGTSVSTLSVVFEASSSEEFVRQYTALDAAVRSQTQVLDDLEEATAVTRNQEARQQAVTERITELKAEADAAVAAADQARAAAAARKAEIEELRADQERLAADLEAQKEEVSVDLHEVEARDRELEQDIARIDAENRRRAEEAARRQAEEAARQQADEAARQQAEEARGRDDASRARPGGATGGGSTASGGFFPVVPTPMVVTSPYGMRLHPIQNIWWMHYGVDLRSACGSPQRTTMSGTVTATKPAAGNSSHGNQVIVNHGIVGGDSYVTVYNHLTRFAVSPGQSVSAGQVIGYTGATGNVTGCHVHYEIWRDGSTIDPMTLPGWN